MISEKVKQEIKRLLKIEGMSQREIVRRTGASRWMVTKVKNGKSIEIREANRLESCLVGMGGRKNRCLTCGALVYGECYECHLKEAKESRELVQVYVGDGKSLDLDLLDEEHERLKELREGRKIQEELLDEDVRT